MSLPTVVEEYIIAAIKHAVPETLEDGTIGAYVPEIPGLVAFGADVHECACNLYVHLEELVRAAVAGGMEMPVLDGVKLDVDSLQLRASYSQDAEPDTSVARFFENEEALEEAFRHFDEVAALQAHGAA